MNVIVTNVAKEVANVLQITRSDESKAHLLRLVATSFVYNVLSLFAKYKDSKRVIGDWCREIERVDPFDVLALLLKRPPTKDVKNFLKDLRLSDLSIEAFREIFVDVFGGDESWVKFLLSYFSKESAFSSTVADVTLLPLYWFLLHESRSGTALYKLSGVGVYEGFKRGDLIRKPVVGFFSLIKVSPEVSVEVRNAVKNCSCLLVKTVKVFNTGKLERMGTRRGSPISKENIVRGPQFQKVATTPFVSEKRLAEFGGIEGLPFDFSLVVWGPITLLTKIRGCKVLVSAEYIHTFFPDFDWATSSMLSVTNEIPYIPVATVVRSDVKVVEEVPLIWFYSISSNMRRVVLPTPRSIDNIKGSRGALSLEFEVSGTHEKVTVLFPSTKAKSVLGASALDAIRVPTEFAETVLKKIEKVRRGLGVLFWLEPLVHTVGCDTIPRWGIYFSVEPTEFTGGVESIYSQYFVKKRFDTLESIRSAFWR